MASCGLSAIGPCPYFGDPRAGHSTLGWLSPEWSRGGQPPPLTVNYSCPYFHTDSCWGHLIQSWQRTCHIKFGEKQVLVQCLKKVKNSLRLLHQISPPSSGVDALVLWPLMLNVVLGIHLASLISLSQWGQPVSSQQEATLDPTLLWKAGRMGLAYNTMCFSTCKLKSKDWDCCEKVRSHNFPQWG